MNVEIMYTMFKTKQIETHQHNFIFYIPKNGVGLL